MVSLETFQEQFGRLKEFESNKDQLIESLMVRVRELEDGLAQKKLDLEREKVTSKAFQSKHRDVEVMLRKNIEEIASNAFVSVLIDGDCMHFVDALVKSALNEGGKDAVHRFRTALYEYVTTELDLPRQIIIRIRIYANIKGLASAYCYNRILESSYEFDQFIRDFNTGHPMCDFVDAGDGKECADSKLKAWFNHDVVDVHCKAIIFGGSADNGYARLLQPYCSDRSKEVVLIEGPPFAKELAMLKDKFTVAHFPDLFRTTKLTSRRVSFSTTPPSTPAPRPSSYAATIASPIDTTAVRVNGGHSTSVQTATPTCDDCAVLQNSKGQRLDPIINPSPALVFAQRHEKLCNEHHLLGMCSYKSCAFGHGPRLDEKGIEARWALRRQNPCPSGLECKKENCLFGHQCPDRACARIGIGCRFSRQMHNVDRM